MGELRFDGQVAIVTGAGGQAPSLGRAHAKFLASRGAKVVVNDSGVGPDGRGSLRANADEVVQEIRAAGGEAVADTHSVAEEQSALAIVQTALDTWGRIDVLVNNASVAHLALFDEFSAHDVEAQIDVHLMGSIWMCRAAWPHMRAAKYGRIVNTASGGVFAGQYLAIYGAAKGGIFSLSNNLASEGAEHNIKVNTVAPGGGTTAVVFQLGDNETSRMMMEAMPPELASAAVAFLGHESCPVSGKFFGCAGGAMAEFFFMSTKGFMSPTLTPEDIRDQFDTICDRTGATEMSPQSPPLTPRSPYTPE
jgi:NAD(P)-dependent dehydrogenase (short-subunit alcohol dehydrogenase family)